MADMAFHGPAAPRIQVGEHSNKTGKGLTNRSQSRPTGVGSPIGLRRHEELGWRAKSGGYCLSQQRFPGLAPHLLQYRHGR
mgnify:FL=1